MRPGAGAGAPAPERQMYTVPDKALLSAEAAPAVVTYQIL